MFPHPTADQLKIINLFLELEFSNSDSFTKTSNKIIVEDENENFIYWIHKGLRKRHEYSQLKWDAEKNFFDVNTNYFSEPVSIQELTEHISNEVIETYNCDDYENICLDLIEKTHLLKNFYPVFEKTERILRYSKKYGQLEYYETVSNINYIGTSHRTYKKKGYVETTVNQWLVCKKRYKKFLLKNNSYSYIYRLNRAQYISFRNFLFIEGINAKINLALLNLHLRSNYILKTDEYKIYNLPNKISKNKNSFLEILKSINPLVPKVLSDNFDVCHLIDLHDYIEHSDITKLVMFLRKHPKVFKVYKNNQPYQIHVEGCQFENKMLWVLYLYMGINLKLFVKATVPDYDIEWFTPTPEGKTQTHLLKDYINLCGQIKQKVSLDITSVKRLKFVHDEAAVIQRSKDTPEIRVNKLFPNFEKSYNDILKKKTLKMELIDNSARLVLESVDMNHCVASYHPQINRGETAIYHIEYGDKNEKLTLQLNLENDKGLLRKAQLRGVWNRTPSDEAIQSIDEILNQYLKDKKEEIGEEFLIATPKLTPGDFFGVPVREMRAAIQINANEELPF